MLHPDAPLAERMRPARLDEVVGQEHLLAEGSPVVLMRDGRHLSSMVLWGPPGTGKTTVARILHALSSPRGELIEIVPQGASDDTIGEALAKKIEELAATGRVSATPLVRKVAQELGVDLASVTGTGPGGRVTEEDVRAAAGTGAPAGGRTGSIGGNLVSGSLAS